MLGRFLLLSVCFFPCALEAQSQSLPGVSSRPAILGTLEQGKYSNQVIGFEIQMDPACAFADESRAIAFSTQLPQRLNLAIRCEENLFVLSSFPLHADEEANLARDAHVSLQGAMDAGGFKKRGHRQSLTIDGTDILAQELMRHGSSGNEVGSYNAFMIGRRYVSILAIGPEANKAQLSRVATTLKIEPSPTH